MPGPLPDENRRRRNPPTIPKTKLPVSGRKGRPPNPPYALGKAGRDWWKWAWGLPQAHAWDGGALYALGRRAQLEDDLAILDSFDASDLADVLGMEQTEALKQLAFIVGRLKSLAGGRLGILKEMRELDKRFGLDPKALAENRWAIVADDDSGEDGKAATAPKKKGGRSARGDRRTRLSVVK